MRVDCDTVTFRFCFRDIVSKTESLLALSNFLHEKEWLPESSDFDSDLMSYHTENDGTCEVTLKKVNGFTIEELTDLFFADLRKCSDVLCAAVLYNEHTDKLVQTHAGRYLNIQSVDLSNLHKSDEVIILHRT